MGCVTHYPAGTSSRRETKRANRNNEGLNRNWVMAQKRPTETALKNVLEMAVELLQDSEEAVTDGMVVLNNSVYMRFRAAVKEATGVVHGIDVTNESDLDDEEDEDEDDEEQPDENED
jgi:hypothetical protein